MRSLQAGFFLMLTAGMAFAQRPVPGAIDRGAFLVGGGASLSRTKTDVEGYGSQVPTQATTTALVLVPSVLWFAAPRFAVGGSANLGRVSGEGATSTNWSVGPAARLYFGSDDRVLPYVGVAVMTGRAHTGAASASDVSSTALDGSAGLTWLLSPHVGLITEAYVNRESWKQDIGSVTDVTYKRTGFGLRLGFNTFLTRAR